MPNGEVTGFWDETLERWLTEGLSVEQSVNESFGVDHWDLVPVNLDLLPVFPEELIEESVPPEVSLANYQHYWKVLRQLAEQTRR